MTPVAPQILETTRNLPLETLSLERALGVDTAGRTAYDSPVPFEANVLLYDTVSQSTGAAFVTSRDGTEHKVSMTLTVPGDETVVPNQGDRITRGGQRFIAEDKKVVHGLEYTPAQPDHTRVRCRDE